MPLIDSSKMQRGTMRFINANTGVEVILKKAKPKLANKKSKIPFKTVIRRRVKD